VLNQYSTIGAQGQDIVPIPGTKRRTYLEQNAAAADVQLSEEDLRRIEAELPAVSGLGSLPLIAQPGERWLYNTGASVLGVVVARAAGQAFEDVQSHDQRPADSGAEGAWRTRSAFLRDLSWGFCQAVYPNGAFGWNGGFGSSWLVDPVGEVAVIVLTQRLFERPEPPQVHVEIQAAALETS
jgi:CubicO group peptidase (beta-lactamase class C family)